MSADRLARVNELLRREIGSALYRVVRSGNIDLAAVTVTHVITSSDLRTARVLVSIRGSESDRRRMLGELRRRRAAIQVEAMRQVVLKYTPRLHFALDDSVRQGNHVLEILSELDLPDDGGAGPAPATPAPEPDP